MCRMGSKMLLDSVSLFLLTVVFYIYIVLSMRNSEHFLMTTNDILNEMEFYLQFSLTLTYLVS